MACKRRGVTMSFYLEEEVEVGFEFDYKELAQHEINLLGKI